MDHPVRFVVEPPTQPRSRLTVAFRPILAIPHVLLVGGPILALAGEGLPLGVLGAFALLCAFFDWVAIVFTGAPIRGLHEWKRLYLRWRARTLAYGGLLRDEYPPFDDGPYPAAVELPEVPAARDRTNVLLRPLFAVPHVIVLVLLGVVWFLSMIVAWLAVLFTGAMPPALWRLGRDVAAYSLRTEAYLLLVHDEFPPFVLAEPQPGWGTPGAVAPARG